MSSDAQDIAVARHVKQAGMASPEQLAAALQAQGRAVESGKPLSLLNALVQVGAISATQRALIEKKVRSDDRKGNQQLLHYKLLKKLGEGGMGAVYLAQDTVKNRKVALKVLPRKHAADPEFMKRFRREAEAACRLQHPNIVRAFEAGNDLGYHFYSMEYCEGEPLDAALKRQGLLTWRRAFHILKGAAAGLKCAHEQGFIHRDIKPANIFLTKDGTPKVLDLGLTKKIDQSQLSFQTASGAILGTPHYISPEQAQSDKEIDGRTDIYSLGATLYHLLTGEPPFSGTTLYEILSKHVQAELPNPQDVTEDVPDGVVHVLRKMMAKNPNDRYEDCGKLLSDVERVLEGKSPESAVLSAGASAVALLRRRVQGGGRKRAGTYRVPLEKVSRRSKAPLVWSALGIAACLLIAVAAWLNTGGFEAPVPSGPVDATWIAEVEKLQPEDQVAHVVGKLRELNPEFDGKSEHRIEGGAVKELRFLALGVTDIAPLRALKNLEELHCTGTWAIPGEPVRTAPLSDLSPLEGLPLRGLWCNHTLVSDLEPLSKMPIERLHLGGTRVADLSPVKNKSLRVLAIGRTPVADLSPVRNHPLEILRVHGTRAKDLSLISGMKLRELTADLALISENADLVKSMNTLEQINFLPVAEFWEKYGPAVPRGLVGWWRLDEGSGQAAGDSSRYEHHGTLKDGAAWTSGRIGGGLQFDGTNSHVEIPNTPLLENVQEGDYTIAAWFKPARTPPGTTDDANDTNYGIVVKKGQHAGLAYNSDGKFSMHHVLREQGPVNLRSSTAFPPGSFYHVVGVVARSAGTMNVYVNGALEGQRSWSPDAAAAEYDEHTWKIGIAAPGRETWRWAAHGIIDDVRLYNRALSAAEVAALIGEGESQVSPPIDAAWIRAVRQLPPARQVEEVMKRLAELNPGFDGKADKYRDDGMKVTQLDFLAAGVSNLTPLRALDGLRKLRCGGRWNDETRTSIRSPLTDLTPLEGLPLTHLDIAHSDVMDLSPLHRMRLEDLNCSSTKVVDLTPLSGMPLRKFTCYYTPIADLSPLEGAPLDRVDVHGTEVVDLTPLKSSPLATLWCQHSRVTDLKPLARLALKELKCDFDPLRDGPVLRKMVDLEQINDLSAAAFWKKADAADKERIRLEDPARWEGADALLPLVRLQKDSVAGRWEVRERSPGGLFSEGTALIQLPYRPPEEYDFRIEFTPLGDTPNVSQIVSVGGRSVQWLLGGYGNTTFAFAEIDESTDATRSHPSAVGRKVCLEKGRTYTSVVEVRRDRLRGYVDGYLVVDMELGSVNLQAGISARLLDPSLIGLRTYKCDSVFHRALVVDVTGKGAVTASSPDASATTVSFQDKLFPDRSYSGTRNTSLVENEPDRAIGNADELEIDGDEPSGTRRDIVSLIKWDITSIPRGSRVRAAHVVFRIADTSQNSYEAYALKRAWSEASATWRVSAHGVPWERGGAKGPKDRGSVILGKLEGENKGYARFDFNTAGIDRIQSWVDDPASNFGVIFANEKKEDGLHLYSRFRGTWSYRPRLVITYVPAAGKPGDR